MLSDQDTRAIALIVAAGQGVRMGGGTRKQYLTLSGHPILYHTIRIFDASPRIEAIYVVVPPEDMTFCREQIIDPLDPGTDIRLVAGGAERQDSVANGLTAIGDEVEEESQTIVLIHDGVRPFVTEEQVAASIAGAVSTGACTLGVPVSDTLKRVDPAGLVDATLERSSVWSVQTPQAFRLDLVRRAHTEAHRSGLRATDDASLVEHLGHPVRVIPGSRYNLKITRKEDLAMAQAIFEMERIG